MPNPFLSIHRTTSAIFHNQNDLKIFNEAIEVFDNVMMAKSTKNLKLSKPVVLIALLFIFRLDVREYALRYKCFPLLLIELYISLHRHHSLFAQVVNIFPHTFFTLLTIR